LGLILHFKTGPFFFWLRFSQTTWTSESSTTSTTSLYPSTPHRDDLKAPHFSCEKQQSYLCILAQVPPVFFKDSPSTGAILQHGPAKFQFTRSLNLVYAYILVLNFSKLFIPTLCYDRLVKRRGSVAKTMTTLMLIVNCEVRWIGKETVVVSFNSISCHSSKYKVK
jgi:hypothetical protein